MILAFLVEKTFCAGFDSLEQNSWTTCSSRGGFVFEVHFSHWPADTRSFLENILGRKQEETKVDGNVNKNYCFLKRGYNHDFKDNEVSNFMECFQF